MSPKSRVFNAGDNADRSTVLCLACSSSLPPLKHISGSSSSTTKEDPNSMFITNCCQRPICPKCIASNPRLARYDPCLACLGGVSVVGSRSASGTPRSPYGLKSPSTPDASLNIDGALRDEDNFVLGDSDDDDDDGQSEDYHSYPAGMVYENLHHDSAPPPPYEHSEEQTVPDEKSADGPESEISLPRNKSSTSDLVVSAPPPASSADEEFASSSSAPYKYYVSRQDTLQGISLRFGVDSQEICKLNKLPTSVMRTMPQLLHTRAFLLLPPSARTTATNTAIKTKSTSDTKVRQREAHLVRERAGKKLQTLTKEVDYHVAKAYVALADDPEEREMSSAKRKEMGSAGSALRFPASGSSASGSGNMPSRGPEGELENLAIQSYLEDNEWEDAERRAGRGPQVRPHQSPRPFSFAAIASKVGL